MKTLFSLTLLAALTGPIYAVDGVILINQSNALAGSVTPGDAPGFPVSITVSGSYRLSSNLIVPDENTDAIDVSANNVTIDLNGFSIIGTAFCSGTPAATSCSATGNGNGISSSSPNTTVLNGDIHGMGAYGIYLVGGDSRVDNVHVHDNAYVGINVALYSKVSSNRVTHNGSIGIEASIGSTVNGNIVDGNAGQGIHVDCVSLIEGNTAISNGGGNIILVLSGCVLVNNAAP